MKVVDLIKKLEKLPQDAEVIMFNKQMWGFEEVKNVQFERWDDNIEFAILHDKEEFWQ